MVKRRVLAVRLDNAGDVLLAGPAIRAMAASDAEVTLLAGPRGESAGRMLPGVDEVMVWRCPWIDPHPVAIDSDAMTGVIDDLRAQRFEQALIFTSFHQSALPTALLLRLAGVPWIGAISDDYPGSLLDLRHRLDDDVPEAERALDLAQAAGFELSAGDSGELAVRRPLPAVDHLVDDRPYLVLHPGTSVPARAWPVERFAEAAKLLTDLGWRVVVTGSAVDAQLTAHVAAVNVEIVDLSGCTTMAELAGVLACAEVVVVGNTGPAHLAAAVGTPVVSLFAPTVPAVRWAPYRVPQVLLGDQQAPCRDTRVTECPFAGHPCLTSVTADDVCLAVKFLTTGRRSAAESTKEAIR